jgi:dethiobiotin synthetase/adenosylmethionine--8-amino-7-oxononanoate aminotransferase
MNSRYVQRYTGQSVSTLFQFNDPVSPHIAARDASYIVRQNQLISGLLY